MIVKQYSYLFFSTDITGDKTFYEEEEVVEEEIKEVKPKPKKKKPELKKAKETKEKIKSERVKVDKKEVRKEKLSPKEQPEEKSVNSLLLQYHFIYVTFVNCSLKMIFFRKIVDIEETQVLESTEIIEETPTEVSNKSQLNNPKEDKNHIHYSSLPINTKNIKLL